MIQELGWCMSSGTGLIPITFSELKAYEDITGTRISPWEARMIRDMSEAYCIGTQDTKAPFQPLLYKLALASASFMG